VPRGEVAGVFPPMFARTQVVAGLTRTNVRRHRQGNVRVVAAAEFVSGATLKRPRNDNLTSAERALPTFAHVLRVTAEVVRPPPPPPPRDQAGARSRSY